MSVIDETLQRYQNMAAQAQMPTPAAYNPTTPMGNFVLTPPTPPPIFSIPIDPSGIASAQAMAYQQIRQNYMSPATAFQAGGAFPGYPNPAQMTSPTMAMFRQAVTPLPAPMTMSPGVTGSFVNPYDAAISGRMQMQYNMFGDPAAAASNWGSMQANAFGRRFGGAVGAVGGFAMGGFGGAATGYGLGEMFGGMLGEIPGVGWAASLPYRGAIQQMSAATRLQAGTHGMLSLGPESMGLGGRGMNVQAALGLGQRLQGFAAESGGAYNINDMLNLTNTAAETGLLAGAVDTNQIYDSIKRLTGLVGKIARLTGDPDFRNNIREIANLKNAGFDLSQIPTVMESMNMSARMAGMSRGQVMQAGGAQGAAIFAGAGLTTGLGMQAGVMQAGLAGISGGTFSPILENLLGGTQGITQRGTEMNAAFASGTAKLLLPYLMGGGGGLDPNRIKQVLGGGISFQNIIGQGAAQMTPQSMQNMLTRTPELLSQLGQDVGGWGMETMQFNLIQSIQKQFGGPAAMTLEMAATIAAGGDPLTGRMLAARYQSPVFRQKLQSQIVEQRQREAFESRQEVAKALAPLTTSDALTGFVEELSGGSRFGAGPSLRQQFKAEDMAREQQQIQDEAVGIRRVLGPSWELGRAEQLTARVMAPGAERLIKGMEQAGVGSKEYYGVIAEQFKRWTGREDLAGLSNIQLQYSPELRHELGRRTAQLREQLTIAGKAVTRFEEDKKDPNKWAEQRKLMDKVLDGDKKVAIAKATIAYAKEQGRGEEAARWDVLRYHIMTALGMNHVDFPAIEDAARNYAFSVMSSSQDEDVKRAYNLLLHTTGATNYMHDPKTVEKLVTEARKGYITRLTEQGIFDERSTVAQNEDALKVIADRPETEQNAAILKALFESGTASDEAMRAWTAVEGTPEGAAAGALLEKLGPTGRRMLVGMGSRLLKGNVNVFGMGREVKRGFAGEGMLSDIGGRGYVQSLVAVGKGLETVTDPTTMGRVTTGTNVLSEKMQKFLDTISQAPVETQFAAGASLLDQGAATLQTASEAFSKAVAEWAKANGIEIHTDIMPPLDVVRSVQKTAGSWAGGKNK